MLFREVCAHRFGSRRRLSHIKDMGLNIMLTKNQFKVLHAVQKKSGMAQREIAAVCDVSLGTASAVVSGLKEEEYLSANGSEVTDEGLRQLKPFKVDNAVIMAAGFASRCAPLSYERPKGLFLVLGEVLIERQIRQLQEAGIEEIYVVVGYMKELFFYLEDKLGVHIVVNDDYFRRNNTSSLYAARYFLRNSYICSSDNYFMVNPFDNYVYDTYFACLYSDGPTDEWCVETGSHERIVKYGVGGSDAWYQIGEFYWTKGFSRRYMDLLEEEYDDPEVADLLLDGFFARHIDELPACVKRYEQGDILEFDTIDEIKRFDDKFVENMDSRIIDNICTSIGCSEGDIGCFEQIKRGNTNVIFSFCCRGSKYVYRHPGKGSEQIIDRYNEAFAQHRADALGIDGTTIAINPAEGWKISRYVEGCYDFQYHDEADALRAFNLMYRLHDAEIQCGGEFNIAANCERFRRLANERGQRSPFEVDELRADLERVFHFVESDGVQKVMCHNDMCDSNIIVSQDCVCVIDWEYAGMADPANDVCSFIVGGEHSHDEVVSMLELYFGRELIPAELRHMYGTIAIVSYHWLLWGVYRQSIGHDAGSLLYYWYRYASDYSKRALELYAPSGRLAIP